MSINLLRLKSVLHKGVVRSRNGAPTQYRELSYLGQREGSGEYGTAFPGRLHLSNPNVCFSTQADSLGGEFSVPYQLHQTGIETPGNLDRKAQRDHRARILRLCKQKTYRAAQAAQNLLDVLAEESVLVGRPVANIALHNNVLDAWAKCESKIGFKRAMDLLQTMNQRHEENPDIFPPPNTVSYNTVLDACARGSNQHQGALSKAESLIQKMEELSMHDADGFVHPNTQSYNLIILAHANQAADRYGAASASEDWLRYLSKRNTEGGPGPDTISFNTVLKAWRDSPEDKGADRALELLNLMIKLYSEDHHEQVSPSEFSFCTVIDAFARRCRPEEGEDVLKMALSFFLDPDCMDLMMQKHAKVNLKRCFNAAIKGWAQSGNSLAPERADALLYDMRSISEESDAVIAEPDVYSYTSCVAAIAKSGRKDAPEIVESRIYAMVEQNRRTNGGVPLPNQATFDCAIRTWFRSSKENKAERMNALLNMMMDLALQRSSSEEFPNPRTVNMCITAWCERGEAKTKALDILNKMEVADCVDSGSYTPLILALLRHGRNNDDDESIYAAAAVLEKFQMQVRRRPDMKFSRDADALYNRVFAALINIGNNTSADRAVSLLEGMEGNATTASLPSVITYSAVITALSKVPSPKRSHIAVNIFEHMVRLHHDPSSKVKLDTNAFHAVLTYLANTNQRWAADRAYEIFTTWKKMHFDREKASDKEIPSFRCYDKCVQAMARCGDINSLARAVNMLKEFVSDFREAKTHEIPSAAGFNTVYKFCMVQGSDDALDLARQVKIMMDDLESNGLLQGKNIA